MASQQLSFRIIEIPTGVSSPHTHLVVSGRGVPQEPLTRFYEHLQKTSAPVTMQASMSRLFSFFSFIEQRGQGCGVSDFFQEEQSCRMAEMKVNSLPPQTTWAGSPSEIRAAVRAYLLARWGCRTQPHGQCEEILLSPMVNETSEIQRFLAALQQFYRFVIERRDYWYDGNPAEAFRLPLHSRLLRALTPFRSRPALHQSRVDEGVKEEIVSASNSSSSQLPVVHWENVETTSRVMMSINRAA